MENMCNVINFFFFEREFTNFSKKKITKTFGKYLQTQYNKSVESEFFDILRIQTKRN